MVMLSWATAGVKMAGPTAEAAIPNAATMASRTSIIKASYFTI
jgi:hypothetical protein